MTPWQLEILQHALGVDRYGRTTKGFTPYTRNYFCAGPADEPDCRALVEMGLMQRHETTSWLPYFNCSVTDCGIKAMHAESLEPPKLSRSQQKLSRSQQRYLREFLQAERMAFFSINTKSYTDLHADHHSNP